MKKFLAGILFALALFAAPVSALAQGCNDASGFLKSFGQIPLGNLLALGPDCQHVQNAGQSISGPGLSIPGNIAFWQDTSGTSLGAAAVFHGVNPGSSALYSQIDSNGLASGVFNAMMISIGPALTNAEQFGSGGARLDQGIVGTGTISTSTGSVYGITGFGKSLAGAGANAIGVGAWGLCGATGCSVWAGADAIHNALTLAANSGFDANSIMGREIDVNIRFKLGGIEPVISQLMGLNITGGGDTAVAQGSAASVGPLNVNNGTKWATAFATRAGASQVAFVAGPNASSGVSVPTQPIQLIGVDSGGVGLTYSIFGDGAKNFTIQSPLNGFVALGDIAGNYINVSATLGGAKVKFPALAAAGVIINGATGILSSSLSLSGLTAVTAGVDGSAFIIGPGGTGANNSFLKLLGSNATAQGAELKFTKNDVSTTSWFIGHVSAIEAAGASSDLEYFNQNTSVRTMRLSIADDSVTFASTVNATSGTVGAINTLGGIGAAKDIFAGGTIRYNTGLSANGSLGVTKTCTIAAGQVLTFTLGILTATSGTAGCV